MREFRIEETESKDKESMEELGRFRLEVWRDETIVNEALFLNGVWLESLDFQARHWVAKDSHGLVGAARLTVHDTLASNPDGYLFERAGKIIPAPVAHLCKLVVHERARGKGLGSQLNKIRVDAARMMGARSIVVTASEINSRLLSQLGFADTGIRESFPNRPGFEFRAMQLVF